MQWLLQQLIRTHTVYDVIPMPQLSFSYVQFHLKWGPPNLAKPCIASYGKTLSALAKSSATTQTPAR